MTRGLTRHDLSAPQARIFDHEPHEPHERAERVAPRAASSPSRRRKFALAAARRARSCGSCGSWFLLAALAACAPKPAGHGAEALRLDCSQPFAAQAERLTAQPGLKAAPKDPAEPYRFYSSEDGATSYLITEPGAPGHPAIMMQRARHGAVATTGCPYGDRKGYDQLAAYLDSLKTWTRK
ncbi:MAG: hypothetical protein JWP49_1198 [Phenylobacterium sp.]|nr:hypothetical protein [Phenylobacterium sp.]